ncbi:hypothetical protein M406DRAFT_49536 [Cryphonectria parasitica EP155]|uniref:NmrA-like domain-containing protein n=1 Tax=Cryphonectria parasitica (strain ATCC 38755 / EP155) TaxID=660469 RepID=A0A9P4XYJ4_CRYP1|nr:uncharacterized protein M406DRAFT_49536 [Cryphonectria parasitica EP155]KAF3763268.1 hypothetical protein M406DRAFT_49536 [Cryphonectria parasitica EP155]
MATQSLSVFVCGVTGNQGGAVAKRLLELNWNVHATVRDLESPKAVALEAAGVKLTQGDWEDEEALKTSIAGCSKMFINLVSTWDDFDRERRQAAKIVDIAKESGVKQVILSTSLGVSRTFTYIYLQPGTMLHTFLKVKKDVEETMKEGRFDLCTIVRPGYFMANFLEPVIEGYSEILEKGTWSTVLKADTRLGLIDHDDVAKFTVAAFQNPDRFDGRAIGLASEFLTPQETLDCLGQAMGRPGLNAVFLTEEDVAKLPAGSFDNPYIKGDKCLEHMEELVDIQELATVIPLTSFKDFLEREKAHVKKL